jgi:primosomal protein N' (replication factor Y)
MYDLVEVAPIPPIPSCDLLTYRVPDEMQDRVRAGVRVRVPLGRGARTGVVAGFTDTHPTAELRAILDVLDAVPFLSDELIALCRWTARYYLASLAEVIATVVPARVPPEPTDRLVRIATRLDEDHIRRLERRAPARARAYSLLRGGGGMMRRVDLLTAGATDAGIRGLAAADIVEVIDAPRAAEPVPPPPPRPGGAGIAPSPDQETAVDAVSASLDAGDAGSFLLYGITGSGKTEVYLRATAHALARDLDVLMLVPEIALTHQLVERTRARFGPLVAVLHSGLGPAERWGEWRRIRRREARIVVGARSAVFAPISRLGLVIVDEEHDGAYKQEDGIRYHGRDLAVVRARLAGAVAVLGSATPSAESYHAGTVGRHRLLVLRDRPGARPLPAVDLVDLRGRLGPAIGTTLVSAELRDAIDDTLARGEQALVFLNRRGFARHLQCPGCGTVVTCPQCSVTLTWHRSARTLACHHCRFQRPAGERCEGCGGPPLEGLGIGTEQVETILRTSFPAARVGRLDRDVAARAGAQGRILADWRAGDLDVLVGTQMISKGHDVPGVTLVAVLLADQSLNVPDFRAAERTMQLLVQVAGRAGRGVEPGRVVIQTLRPGHACIQAALAHDYTSFITAELERRRELLYPPFARLVGLHFDADDLARVDDASRDVAERLRVRATELGLPTGTVLGPAPPPIERLRGRWRRHVLLRAAEPRLLRPLARAARAHAATLRRCRVRLVVDVDSYSI